MQEIKVSKTILLLFSLFLYPIIIGKFAWICYLLLYGTASSYIILNKSLVGILLRNLNLKELSNILLFIFLIVLSVFYPIVNGGDDLSYVNVVLSILRQFIILFFLMLTLVKKYQSKFTIRIFMYYYVCATCLYVLSTFVFLFFPSFREVWKSIIGVNPQLERLFATYGYTARFGWSGFSGFRMTISCTISLIFTLMLYFEPTTSCRINYRRFITLLMLSFIGNMFYGRMGIIASLICFILALILYHKINIFKMVNFSIAAIVVFVILFFLKERITIINQWYDWATTPFFNFISTGSFNNYSAEHLLNDMIFMPESKTLFWGDGRYVDAQTGLYYMRTDSGFMRQLLFWGLGGTFLSYLLVVKTIFQTKRKNKVFQFLLLVAFCIFEYKGEVYYSFIPLAFLLFLSEVAYTQKGYLFSYLRSKGVEK